MSDDVVAKSAGVAHESAEAASEVEPARAEMQRPGGLEDPNDAAPLVTLNGGRLVDAGLVGHVWVGASARVVLLPVQLLEVSARLHDEAVSTVRAVREREHAIVEPRRPLAGGLS